MKMGRKCSQCGITGHNSRTCTNSVKGYCCNNNNSNTNNFGGLRLFGVQLEISSSSSLCSSSSPSSSSTTNSCVAIKKSLSFDCLSSSSPLSSRLVSVNENCEIIKTSINGYLSDDIAKVQDKRKGVPWTEQEHRKFLIGLEKLGKGDWRGISRNFVTTRTPTQIASHAQKYFLRQTSLNHKKRRASLFDMVGSHQHKSNHEDDQENVHSFIDLNSFGDDDQEMMKTIKDDDNDQDDCKTTSSNHNHHCAETIDLELALGAPKDVDKA